MRSSISEVRIFTTKMKTLCDNCKREFELPDSPLEEILTNQGIKFVDVSPEHICPDCSKDRDLEEI